MPASVYALSHDETAHIKRALATDVVRLVLAPLLTQVGDYNECADLLAMMAWEQVKAPVHSMRVRRQIATRQLERTEKWSFRLRGPDNPLEPEAQEAASQAYTIARVVLTHMAGYYPQAFSAPQVYEAVGFQLRRVPESDYLDILRLYVHLGLLVQVGDPDKPGHELFRARQPTISLPPELVGALLERSRNFLRLIGPVAESAMRQQGTLLSGMGRATPEDIESLRQQLVAACAPIVAAFDAKCTAPDYPESQESYAYAIGVGQLFAEPRDVLRENQNLPRPRKGGHRKKRR